MKKLILLSLISVFALSSCASLFKGSAREITFDKPEGSDVYIDGQNVGQAPVKISLSTDKSYQVQFKRGEKQSKTYYLTRDLSTGWLIWGSLTGMWFIDGFTGAWFYLDKSAIDKAFDKKESK